MPTTLLSSQEELLAQEEMHVHRTAQERTKAELLRNQEQERAARAAAISDLKDQEYEQIQVRVQQAKIEAEEHTNQAHIEAAQRQQQARIEAEQMVEDYMSTAFATATRLTSERLTALDSELRKGIEVASRISEHHLNVAVLNADNTLAAAREDAAQKEMAYMQKAQLEAKTIAEEYFNRVCTEIDEKIARANLEAQAKIAKAYVQEKAPTIMPAAPKSSNKNYMSKVKSFLEESFNDTFKALKFLVSSVFTLIAMPINFLVTMPIKGLKLLGSAILSKLSKVFTDAKANSKAKTDAKKCLAKKKQEFVEVHTNMHEQFLTQAKKSLEQAKTTLAVLKKEGKQQATTKEGKIAAKQLLKDAQENLTKAKIEFKARKEAFDTVVTKMKNLFDKRERVSAEARIPAAPAPVILMPAAAPVIPMPAATPAPVIPMPAAAPAPVVESESSIPPHLLFSPIFSHNLSSLQQDDEFTPGPAEQSEERRIPTTPTLVRRLSF